VIDGDFLLCQSQIMAGKLRVEFPCVIYHVRLRGNGKMNVFKGDRARERFLLRLSESVNTYDVRVYMFT